MPELTSSVNPLIASPFPFWINIFDSCYRLLNLPEKSVEIRKLSELFVSSPFIDIAVVGQFKAGKSSFINSLLGESVVPAGVLPVTSVITRIQFGEMLLPMQERLIPELNTSFEQQFACQKGVLYQVTRWFEQWIISNIKIKVAETKLQTIHQIDAFLLEKSDYYSLFIKSFQQSYKKFIHDLYHVDMHRDAVQVSPLAIGQPDISISRIFDSHLDLFFFFIPVTLIRPLLRNYLKKQIEYEIEKNLRRHVSLLTEKIFMVIDRYHQSTSKTILDELNTLERLIASKADAEKPFLEMDETLQKIIQELQT